MSPGACQFGSPSGKDRQDRGALSAMVVALLFAVVAVTSFAVEQSVTLTGLPPLSSSAGR